MNQRKHGLTGKPSNASKPYGDISSSHIHARCKASDKAIWTKAAQSRGMKLTEWIVSALNDAAKR